MISGASDSDLLQTAVTLVPPTVIWCLLLISGAYNRDLVPMAVTLVPMIDIWLLLQYCYLVSLTDIWCL